VSRFDTFVALLAVAAVWVCFYKIGWYSAASLASLIRYLNRRRR
jgi:hypothetical protein